MATYANATNPFIDINGSLKKSAPGMARPHKAQGDEKSWTKANEKSSVKIMDQLELSPKFNCPVGHHNDYQRLKIVDLEETTKQTEGEQQKQNKDLLLPLEANDAAELMKYRDDQQDDLGPKLFEVAGDLTDDVIAETCRSLVEMAAKLSVEDDNKASQADKTASECIKLKCCPKLISSSTNDANDDEDELAERGDEETRTPVLLDSRRYQHIELIEKLRLQLRDLERYAYERGELGEQVPASVLAERQSVIIETLKKKLSLNLDKDKIERLELDELKEQVDKEIDDLIDPLKTKEQLLSQLKTQLTDLERYVSHLHITLSRRFSDPSKSSTPGLSNITASEQCICPKHGTFTVEHLQQQSDSIMDNDSLPRTSRLIRGLMSQLICSDIKIQEATKKDYLRETSVAIGHCGKSIASATTEQCVQKKQQYQTPVTKAPQFHDGAIWTLHLDKVILATDSLMNLYSLDQENKSSEQRGRTVNQVKKLAANIDETLVESVVRRQLVPALRDLLSYGLIDPSLIPRSNTYTSFLFDPYYLFSSLTCFPGLNSSSTTEPSKQDTTTSSVANNSSIHDDGKIHLWDIFEDYYQSRSDSHNFKNSSVKTLSQSFQLTPSMNGPIKITSKQALLIAIDDVDERMIKCKPNGPESHFKMLVYVALNQSKLATWLRIIFKNKSVIRKYYHNFSFVSQPEKMDRFLAVLDSLSGIEFKLAIDRDHSVADQFVSAF